MQQIINRKIKIPFSRPTKTTNHSFLLELEEWSKRLERWLSYFKQNKERERHIAWQLPQEECQLSEEKQKALAYLLDQFGHAEEFEEYSGKQLAQGYHPLLVREAKSLGTPSQSQGTHKEQRILELYQECLAFYSAEEKRHADEFFQLLRNVGGQPTPPKPPDPLTSMVLKIFSLGTPLDNLAALHVTELISCEFYQRLKDNLCEDPLSQAVFAAVIRDERAHLAFHASYLSWATPQLNWRQKKVMWFKNSLSYFLMAGPIYFFLAKGYRPLVSDNWWEWFKMCRDARHKAYQRELRFLRQF